MTTTVTDLKAATEQIITDLINGVNQHRLLCSDTSNLAKHLKPLHTEFALCCTNRNTPIAETQSRLRAMIIVELRLLIEGDATLPHTVPDESEDTSQGAIFE